ncbi:cell division protein FtsA [Alloprevotella sp. oral taxon 473]|jgi:cell division protein ftsA|uniref:cell division protein FtsA n=1 Tax=Alloprevotella sp. oral taxon 473 TaxID=712469 RepID=UPI0002A3CC2C|nr:cell division protein FtsA [Alloprevotella sp. oral taxon 473]EKX91156.1 cell division protein FtsA [Alloprevotella sp. oral taxon 473 str. F0040]
MPQDSFIAAIVLGSFQTTGIVGQKTTDGSIKVLSFTSALSSEFISKGRVYNLEKMTNCLKNIKEHLEEQINCNIGKFYVSVNCMGIRSVTNSVTIPFSSRETITPDVVRMVLEHNQETRSNDHLYLEAIPLEYRVGTMITNEPVGMQSDNIRADFLNISCNSTVIETIETCFRRAGITIAKLTLSTTDLGNVIPTEQERNSGCIFVDMGSQTTTVAVYKSRLLRHLAVIPLGSDNITQDIVKVFNCDENRAEELKRTYGYPDFQSLDDSEENHIVLEGGRKYSQKSLAEIIEARVEEIIQNVAEQAKRANISFDKLVNGVIVTGGAAQLRNISKAFEQHFKDLNLRIVNTPPRLSVIADDHRFNQSGTYNVGLAIIETGEIDCNGGERIIPQEPTLFTEEHSQAAETNAEIPVVAPAVEEPAEPETPKPAKENIFKRVGKYLSSLVSDNE